VDVLFLVEVDVFRWGVTAAQLDLGIDDGIDVKIIAVRLAFEFEVF